MVTWSIHVGHIWDIAQYTRHMRRVNRWCVCLCGCGCTLYFIQLLVTPLQETAGGCIAERYMFRHVVLGYCVVHVSSCWTFSWQQIQHKQITARVITLQIRTAVRYMKMYIHKSSAEHIPLRLTTVSGFYVGTESKWTFLLSVLDDSTDSTSQNGTYISHSYTLIKVCMQRDTELYTCIN